MKKNYTLFFTCICLAFINFLAIAQEPNRIMQNEKQVVYKINNYNAESEKIIKKEFSNDKEFKIVFSCLQTGMIVVESKGKISPDSKDKIQQKLKKTFESIEFLHVQDCNMKDAENKCILSDHK